MAVASVNTFTLLNAWQRRMSVDIWHFNQVTGAGVNAPLSTNGEGIYVQPEREFIAEGIVNALALALPHLQFYHRPVFVSELIPMEKFRHHLQYRPLLTKWKYLDAIGSRGTTLIEAGASVVYSDEDSDGIDETATITVATTLTDPTEIQAFFRVADGADGASDERWQIEPLKVTISGGNAVLVGHRALFVKPSVWALPYRSPNYNSASKNYANTANAGDFVTTVDVYRVYPDATSAVKLLYNPFTYCNPNATTMGEIEGTAVIEDSRLGSIFVKPSSACSYWYNASYVQINYRAGYPLDVTTGLPDRALETALLRLSNAEQPQEPANFNDASLMVWQRDAYLYPQGEIPPNLIDNPFGVKRGQVEAWRTIMRYGIARGGVL